MCKNITTQKLKEWIKENKEVQIIDVREAYEFQDEHIKQAKLIPLGELQSRINEVKKEKPVVFVCRSGARSGMACMFASRYGYETYNMQGGMMSW